MCMGSTLEKEFTNWIKKSNVYQLRIALLYPKASGKGEEEKKFTYRPVSSTPVKRAGRCVELVLAVNSTAAVKGVNRTIRSAALLLPKAVGGPRT